MQIEIVFLGCQFHRVAFLPLNKKRSIAAHLTAKSFWGVRKATYIYKQPFGQLYITISLKSKNHLLVCQRYSLRKVKLEFMKLSFFAVGKRNHFQPSRLLIYVGSLVVLEIDFLKQQKHFEFLFVKRLHQYPSILPSV